DPVLLDGVGGVDRHLVVGAVAVLDAEVEIFQVDVERGMDQLVLDELPDDPGHLIAVDFDDGIFHLYLRHGHLVTDLRKSRSGGRAWKKGENAAPIASLVGKAKRAAAIRRRAARWKRDGFCGRARPAAYSVLPRRMPCKA